MKHNCTAKEDYAILILLADFVLDWSIQRWHKDFWPKINKQKHKI